MKILVVEDEERIRKVIKSFLEKKGYNVKEACDGEEGLDIFYEWNPDLILLDVMMPKKDGYEVCRAVREEKSTPILMLTAKTQEEDEIRGLEIGADDYIRKPFSLKILELRLKNLLGDEIYTIGNFSKEICGGPHVKHTGELGKFKIKKEESSSSGIRRIKAVLIK